jgi:hypothetical protein
MQKLIAASLWLLVAQTASATLLYVDYDGVIMESTHPDYVILDAKGCATLPGGTACDADIRPSMLSISASLFNTGLQFSMLDAVQSFELTSSDEIGAKLSGTYYEWSRESSNEHSPRLAG